MKYTYTCDAATSDLYENGICVGKLKTGNNGAWFRLISQANEEIIKKDIEEQFDPVGNPDVYPRHWEQ